jgi:hypothetical protein
VGAVGWRVRKETQRGEKREERRREEEEEEKRYQERRKPLLNL